MKCRPKVSILIPIYNVEPYLRKCLNSVVNQTLKDIEIICVNDGSKDNSLQILKEFAEKDSRIIVIDKENGGYGKAMNIASQKATGEYIGIVEPDDFVELNMFEVLYNKAKEYDLDFIKSDFYRFAKDDDNGNVLYTYNHLSKIKTDYNKVINPRENLESFKWIMNTWCGIYKQEFLKKYDITYNETPGASFQDNGFWFQTFVYASKVMILDTPFYLNRRDNPNSSVKDKSKVYAMNVEYEYIRKIIEKDGETWNRVKAYYWWKKYENYRATLNRIDNSVKNEYVSVISREFAQAIANKEIDFSVFTDYECKMINFLKNNSEEFLKNINHERQKSQNVLEQKLIAANKEISRIKNSKSFKIGLIITKVPRKIKAFFKRTFKK